ncbi:alpha/beta fold hydrolase [Micromonospora sp. NPDC050187]
MIDLTTTDGTRLALHDLGGAGEPVLLLPGLCGHAGEWSATAPG